MTEGTSWSASLFHYKSVYEWAASESRHRSIPQYVDHAHQEGHAVSLAGILSDIAKDIGFRSKREQSTFVIDFVQNLPYVSDDVGTGYNDYSKFVSETLVEANGDCEDTSILAASILSAEPFNYDVTLLYPPQHVAVGIYGTDLPDYYYEYDGRKYYYLETTGEGWGVGDIPEDYRGESVRIVDV